MVRGRECYGGKARYVRACVHGNIVCMVYTAKCGIHVLYKGLGFVRACMVYMVGHTWVLVAQGLCLVEGYGIVDGGTLAVGREDGIHIVGPRARKQFHLRVCVGSGETREGHKSHELKHHFSSGW